MLQSGSGRNDYGGRQTLAAIPSRLRIEVGLLLQKKSLAAANGRYGGVRSRMQHNGITRADGQPSCVRSQRLPKSNKVPVCFSCACVYSYCHLNTSR